MSDGGPTPAFAKSKPNSVTNRATWSSILALLGMCAVALLVMSLLSISTDVATNYNEGWNAYRDQMAAQHVPLYASPPGLNTTNYPFLSFHIIGLLSRITKHVNVTGRIVALTSLIVTCWLIAAIARELQGSWRMGAYAALCFFVWLSTYTPDRLVMNDPQLLATAFSTLGLFAYVRGPQSVGWLLISALAFAAAVFTKNNLIAFPITVALYQVFERRWRELLIWAGIGVAASCVLLFLTLRLDGHYFFTQLLLSRSISAGRGFARVSEFAVRFYAPILIGIGWFVLVERSTNRRLLLVGFAVAYTLAVVFAFGNGVGENIFYDTLIAIAIAGALAIGSIERVLPDARWAQAIFAMLIALPALPGIISTPYQFFNEASNWRKLSSLRTDVRNGIVFLKSVPGPVLCENLLLCFDAGKPMGYDAYFVFDQIRAHHIQESDVIAQIQSQRYKAIEIGDIGDLSPIADRARNRFSAPFMHTLLMRYRPALATPRFTIFVPSRAGGVIEQGR